MKLLLAVILELLALLLVSSSIGFSSLQASTFEWINLIYQQPSQPIMKSELIYFRILFSFFSDAFSLQPK